MHVDPERVQRLLDRQLDPADAALLRSHLAECETCRAAFAEQERDHADVARLLGTLSEPESAAPFDVDEIIARAGMRNRALARPMAPAGGRLRLAAGILAAVVVAGAALAAPGSPVRDWIGRLIRVIDAQPEPPPPPVAPVVETPATPGAGIAVAPGAATVLEFARHAAGAVARVRLVDRTLLRVHGPAGSAGFTTGEGRVIVDNRTSPDPYDIEIPRGAPRIEIRVVGRALFRKNGAAIVALVPAGNDSTWVLPLAP